MNLEPQVDNRVPENCVLIIGANETAVLLHMPSGTIFTYDHGAVSVTVSQDSC